MRNSVITARHVSQQSVVISYGHIVWNCIFLTWLTGVSEASGVMWHTHSFTEIQTGKATPFSIFRPLTFFANKFLVRSVWWYDMIWCLLVCWLCVIIIIFKDTIDEHQSCKSNVPLYINLDANNTIQRYSLPPKLTNDQLITSLADVVHGGSLNT